MILAIDTATSTCSVALLENGSPIARLSDVADKRHNEALPGMVGKLLAENALTYRNINTFAVSIGPGSFTGLRVGLSFAKGVVLATGAILVPVETLSALALTIHNQLQNYHSEQLICPLVIARKNESFGQLFSIRNGLPTKESEPFLVGPEELLSTTAGKNVIFGGEGWDVLSDKLADRTDSHTEFVDNVRTEAVSVGIIAHDFLSAENVELPPARDIEPMYIKEFTIKTKLLSN